jgi:oligopeptide transport system substrate-binding protein
MGCSRCIVALALLALAACGSDRGSTPSGEVPITTLTRALGGEPATVEPRLAEDNASLALMQDLYEGLTTAAADGSIVAGAAQSWTVSPDGRRWTFQLRENLRWSDGEPLEAAHFVSAFDAVRGKDSQAPYAALLQDIVEARATAPRTITLDLARPVPHLPAVLALPVAAPQRPVQAGQAHTGNGPYRLLSRRPGERIELGRNPHFHDAKTVAIEHVTYLTLDDLNTELNLYRAGDLDITSEVPNAQVAWLRQNLPDELQVSPYLSTYSYAVNLRRLPDRDARTALAMAIDRRQLTELVTGAGELPAYGWVPPGIPGYAPAAFEWAGLEPGERRSMALEKWRAARDRRRAPGRLTLCTDSSANHHRTAVALADQWRSTLGVDVAIVEMEWKAYLLKREEPADCDLLRFGWSADFVDAEAFLALFGSGHPQNVAGYSNPDFDSLLQTSRTAADSAQRSASLAQAEALLLGDAAVIPVFHRVTKRLVKPYVSGVVSNPLGQSPSRYLTLQPAKKQGGRLAPSRPRVDREVRGSSID